MNFSHIKKTRTNSPGAVKKILNKRFIFFFNLEDFIFISISVIFIFWWMFKDIVENQDLYIKKDDF